MRKHMVRRTIIVLIMLAMTLGFGTSAFAGQEGNLIRFIPVNVDVTDRAITVNGYFVNLNQNCDVKNFRNFEMSVYRNGNQIATGSFGTINTFTVTAMATKYQSFTFNGRHNLNNGHYECNDYYYCAFSCNFTSVGF